MLATIDWAAVGLACLLLVIVVLMAGLVLRRRVISHGEPMSLMAISRHSGWRLGMIRLTTDNVQWFPLIGVGLRPKHVWCRAELDLGAPGPLSGTRPLAITDPVEVRCTAGGCHFLLIVARGDYTALRSWSESSPPGLNANVA